MSAIGYYNGTIGPLDTMQVPMNDRAVYFGDGCYEACLAVRGKLFRGEAHLDRFERSLTGLRIPFAMQKTELLSEVERCIRASGEQSASVYWQVSRGTGRRRHTFLDADVPANLMITVTHKDVDLSGRPMRLITAEDIRYRMCHIKTLNLIPNILAGQRALDAGADGAVLVRDGFVTEGSHTNIHILKDGVLYTHPADNLILSGVTRGVLLELCGTLGIAVSETPFTPQQMKDADEVLITSSLMGVRSASSIDGVPTGGKAPALREAIIDAYRRVFIEELHL